MKYINKPPHPHPHPLHPTHIIKPSAELINNNEGGTSVAMAVERSFHPHSYRDTKATLTAVDRHRTSAAVQQGLPALFLPSLWYMSQHVLNTAGAKWGNTTGDSEFILMKMLPRGLNARSWAAYRRTCAARSLQLQTCDSCSLQFQIFASCSLQLHIFVSCSMQLQMCFT